MSPLSEEVIAAYLAKIPATTRQESMSKRTSFRVGGAAALHTVAFSSDALVDSVVAALDLGLPFYLYGGGSNLLVSDDGFSGVMIQAAHRNIHIKEHRVFAEAGAITSMVARQSVEAGLTGFEWAIGVPGTIGGAIYGNAGCYGGDMSDSVVLVDVYDLTTRQRKNMAKTECGFEYRESRFKHERMLILGCEMLFAPSTDVQASRKRMNDIVALRKEKQPLDSSSAGCAFKNFEFSDPTALDILQRSVEVPESMLRNKSISAGWLIDQVGMMGASVGDAQVSLKHGNFFLNKGNARAQDLLALISRVKMKVRDEFGIELQEEVQLVGF